jgi:hypothetical protein
MAVVMRVVLGAALQTGMVERGGKAGSMHCAWRWRYELRPMHDSAVSSAWANTESTPECGCSEQEGT